MSGQTTTPNRTEEDFRRGLALLLKKERDLVRKIVEQAKVRAKDTKG